MQPEIVLPEKYKKRKCLLWTNTLAYCIFLIENLLAIETSFKQFTDNLGFRIKG
jgi:hypothetical protein